MNHEIYKFQTCRRSCNNPTQGLPVVKDRTHAGWCAVFTENTICKGEPRVGGPFSCCRHVLTIADWVVCIVCLFVFSVSLPECACVWLHYVSQTYSILFRLLE